MGLSLARHSVAIEVVFMALIAGNMSSISAMIRSQPQPYFQSGQLKAGSLGRTPRPVMLSSFASQRSLGRYRTPVLPCHKICANWLLNQGILCVLQLETRATIVTGSSWRKGPHAERLTISLTHGNLWLLSQQPWSSGMNLQAPVDVSLYIGQACRSSDWVNMTPLSHCHEPFTYHISRLSSTAGNLARSRRSSPPS